MAEPTVRATEYVVSLLPEDDINAGHYEVTIAWRGHGKWAIVHGGRWCLSRSGEWDYEMQPSSREDDWLATHRWELSEALDKAKEVAPGITVNGITAQQVYDRAVSRGR